MASDARTFCDSSGGTHPGLKRDTNEDQYLIAEVHDGVFVTEASLPLTPLGVPRGPEQARVLLVADGLGGHRDGARASKRAAELFVQFLARTKPWIETEREDGEDPIASELVSAIRVCDLALRAEAEGAVGLDAPGTTLTSAYLAWPNLYVAHVGDSRAYLLRGGEFRQLTHDHTVAQRFVERGQVRPEDRDSVPGGGQLTNTLGAGHARAKPETTRTELRSDDVVLLCTDGLTDAVSPEGISMILENCTSSSQACQRLIEAANEKGGPDNVTVVVAICSAPESGAAGRDRSRESRASPEPR